MIADIFSTWTDAASTVAMCIFITCFFWRIIQS